MANHTRVRDDLTAWSSGAVSPSEFDQLDEGQFDSVSASGGTYAPSPAIEFGGDGIIVSGPFDSTGAFDFDGDGEFNGSVTFTGPTEFTGATVFGGTTIFDSAATFGAAVTIAGALTANGNVTLGNAGTDQITINGAVDFASGVSGGVEFNSSVSFNSGAPVLFADNVDINGDCDFGAAGNVDFNGPVNFDGEVTFDAAATILGSPTLGTRLRFTDTGRVPHRHLNISSTRTLAVEDGDFITVSGADSTITIEDTGAAAGDRFWVLKTTPDPNVTIALPNSGSITMPTGDRYFACFIRSSTVWHAVRFAVDAYAVST